MTFAVQPVDYFFRTLTEVRFPALAANAVRGALGAWLRQSGCAPDCVSPETCLHPGSCPYGAIFRPARKQIGPSGIADPPRPFVLRTSHLNRAVVPADGEYRVRLVFFAPHSPWIEQIGEAFRRISREGLCGGKARLESVAPSASIPIDLFAHPSSCSRLRLSFRTPTELKSEGKLVREPRFEVLFARLRDRLSNLIRLYGETLPEFDFQAQNSRAKLIQLESSCLEQVKAQRTSRTSGDSHPLGGFQGWADYGGDLSEFLPYLEAARWTGVGRHCVWGNGEMTVELPPE